MTKLTPQQRAAQTRAKNKAAEDAKVQAEADTKAQAEADAKAQVEADAKAQAEADAKAQAEADAKAQAEADTKAQAEADAKAQAEADAKAQAEADAKAQAEKEQNPDETPTQADDATKTQSQVVQIDDQPINLEKAGFIELIQVVTKKPKKTFWRCGRHFSKDGCSLFVVDSVPMAIAENDGLLVFITEEEAARLKREPWLEVTTVELTEAQ